MPWTTPARRIGLALMGVATSLVIAPAAPSEAATTTVTTAFTTRGCSTFDVPLGVTTVLADAIGAAGADSAAASGGTGARFRAQISGLPRGSRLYVCVDVGGGDGDRRGGGASGVSIGTDFSLPVLIAGGGGGAGPTSGTDGGDSFFRGADGASICAPSSRCTGQGGDTANSHPGLGGAGDGSTTPRTGAATTAQGPGVGGAGFAPGERRAGAGGGAGFFGGGGALVGGAGAGSSMCMGPGGRAPTVVVSQCTLTASAGTFTAAGADPGYAKVALTYELPTTAITFTTAPAEGAAINDPTPAIGWAVTPAEATVTCRLGDDPLPCTNGAELAALPDGPTTFAVTASANGQSATATRSWVQDTTAPSVAITGGTPEGARTNAPRVEFASPDPDVVRYECRLGGGSPFPCTSPYEPPAFLLNNQTYVFRVAAVDAAGNVGAPASRSYVVDLVAPTARFTGGPADGAITNRPPVYTFDSPDADVARLECTVDLGAWSPCTSPAGPPVVEGRSRFSVRAVDTAGNVGATNTVLVTYDSVAPVISFIAGPADGAAVNTAPVYNATATEVNARECRLDEEVWTTCRFPFAVPSAGLTEGEHTFAVRATDRAGNLGVATRRFVYDLTAPDVRLVGPAAGAEVNTPPRYALRSVATDVQRYECRIDDDAWQGCATDLVVDRPEGRHTVLVRAVDHAGNIGEVDATSFVYDTTAPRLALLGGPAPGARTASAPTYGIDSPDADVAALTCRLDDGPTDDCTGRTAVTVPAAGLGDGTHRVTVSARDRAGNTTTTSITFVLDTAGPVLALGILPIEGARLTTVPTFTVVSEASDLDRLECRLDEADWVRCSSPFTPSLDTEGPHTVRVRGVDDLGNRGPVVARGFVLDRTPPTVAFTSGPAHLAEVTGTVSYGVGGPDADLAGLQCRIDDGAWASCVSPVSVATASLTEGPHRLHVRGVDLAGNIGPAVSRGFVVDRTAPVVRLQFGPPDRSISLLPAQFGFTSTATDLARFECSRDAAPYAACTSPTYGGPGFGTHVFRVRAVDRAGNVGPVVTSSYLQLLF